MRHLFALALLAAPIPAFAADAPAATAQAAIAYSAEDTDIGTLLDDPVAKAILDKHIPGMTTNAQIEMARSFTLRQIQQFAPDQVTDDVIAKVDADFKALTAR